ncbi:hypothetical protein QJS10_CPA01g01440 [Acorus calamus]|uniref:Zinc knuckle CX2CX4HX4C domain-containing protein n=1 Tax=Acorus calamus TaxID=4465 RepID=A0AAV9FHH5_ACOCL|nr:hypothetical protein QJS10_CPA01g01440 [Acorus calamus]
MSVLSGGPWIIQDHILSLMRWRDNFDPSTATFELTPIWIRYARALVEVDLRRPLCPGVWIGQDKRWQSFVYEKIPRICQICGRISHATEACEEARPEQNLNQVGSPDSPLTASEKGEVLHEINSSNNGEKSSDGPWRVVPPRRRPRNPPVEGKNPVNHVNQIELNLKTQESSHSKQMKGPSTSASSQGARNFASSKISESKPSNNAQSNISQLKRDDVDKSNQAERGNVSMRRISSPIVQPMIPPRKSEEKFKEISIGPEMKKDSQIVFSQPQPLALVERAVDRAHKKRGLDSQVVLITEDQPNVPYPTIQPSSSKAGNGAMALFRCSWSEMEPNEKDMNNMETTFAHSGMECEQYKPLPPPGRDGGQAPTVE